MITTLFLAAALAACGSPQGARSTTLVEEDGGIAIRVDGELFTRYHAAEDERPSFHPVLAPGGLPVTRGFPFEERAGEEHDHPHHTSLWFAHGAVDGFDFWHADPTKVRFHTIRAGIEDGHVLSETEWIGGGEVLLTEHRTVTFGSGPDARWMDFDLELRPREGGVTLGDTKEGTFALRLAATLRAEGPVAAGELLDSEGRSGGDVWGKRARWIAARGPVDGQPVTVALLDHPGNPRHPTRWHARTYGLLAANPFGLHDFEGAPEKSGDLRLEAPTLFRYRLWVARGTRPPEELERVWSEYAH